MQRDETCLYTLFHAPPERHDDLLLSLVIPVVREIRAAPEMDCIFFARYSEPDWQLRFRVLGRPAWVEGLVRGRIESRLPAAREGGLFDEVEFARYQREWERYGGEAGMPLAESIFLHDTLAGLDLLEAEAGGDCSRSRREWSLLFTERFLDLFGLTPQDKVAFYRYGHDWALRDGEWNDADLRALDAKFEALAPGIEALLAAPIDDAAAWGGPAPARIATRALAALRPTAAAVRAGLRAGSIRQEPIYLLWSYAHMHANRLGIPATGEAILRYFMWRRWSASETRVA